MKVNVKDRCFNYIYLNQFDKAEEYIKNWRPSSVERIDVHTPLIGYVYYKLGKLEKAEEVFNLYIKEYKFNMDGSGSASSGARLYGYARICAFQNQKEEALKTLEEVVRIGATSRFNNMIMIDPMFENLWDDPELLEIVNRVREDFALKRAKIREMEERGELDF